MGRVTVKRVWQLDALGQSEKERNRLARKGELVHVRHGAYADELAAGALEAHRQLIAGTVPLLAPGTVLSHVSAGVLHGLPCWESMLGRVTVVRRSGAHGSVGRVLHARSGSLAAEELALVGGFACTSLERTAIDLACILGFERGVAVMDAALRTGGRPEAMLDIIARSSGRHGAAAARAALAFADGRAESVGESLSRVRLAEAGLARPELQLNVFAPGDHWLARCDFGWEEQGVLGEFDGKVKYTGAPSEVARAVMAEKQREARLREAGWVVVRWGWDDLSEPAALRRRIEAAFRQARPDQIRGRVAIS